MRLSEAIAQVEGLMTIDTLFDVNERGKRVQAAFVASRTYEEDGETKTQHGDGSFIITQEDEGDFQPAKAYFSAKEDGRITEELDWRWGGDKFYLLEENACSDNPVPTVERRSSG